MQNSRVAPVTRSLDRRWSELRSVLFLPQAESIIRRHVPSFMGDVTSISHIRSAHYTVLRVDVSTRSFVVRIGVVDSADDEPVDNSGRYGTSRVTPTGQQREYLLGRELAAAGSAVCAPVWYERTSEGYDLQWLPFVTPIQQPITAQQWYTTLLSMWAHRPKCELPVFTNRAKTFGRLAYLPVEQADDLRMRYEAQLADLFAVTSVWSVVHGDAHGGNAFNVDEGVVLFDLDTACWAPSVWDATHLLSRAGTTENDGYSADELRALLPFSDVEVAAALALRRTAAEVARLVRTA